MIRQFVLIAAHIIIQVEIVVLIAPTSVNHVPLLNVFNVTHTIIQAEILALPVLRIVLVVTKLTALSALLVHFT